MGREYHAICVYIKIYTIIINNIKHRYAQYISYHYILRELGRSFQVPSFDANSFQRRENRPQHLGMDPPAVFSNRIKERSIDHQGQTARIETGIKT
jgi:hypothetical protein